MSTTPAAFSGETQIADRNDRNSALRRFAVLLDSQFTIPGTKFSLGLDSIIGLVPVAGDAVGALISAGILIHAARNGARKRTLVRMAKNILVDGAVGAVPLLGDFFDMRWKANVRNIDLLTQDLQTQNMPVGRSPRQVAGLFITALLCTLFLALGLFLWLLMQALKAIF